jgi:hypothetical protein
MAEIQVKQNGLKDLNLNRFKSVLDAAGSVSKACRFIVSIRPPEAIRTYPKDLHYLCETADLPGRGFSLATLRDYGPSQMIPTNTEYQPLSLTFICRADSKERRFFDDWMDYINPVNNFNFRYPNTYHSEINIYQYTEWGNPNVGSTTRPVPTISYSWKLLRAWPTLINDQPVNWADQDVLRLQVAFAYKYWERSELL